MAIVVDRRNRGHRARLTAHCSRLADADGASITRCRFRPAEMGLAGRMAYGAHAVGAGLCHLVNFLNLHDNAAAVELVGGGGRVSLVHAICESGMVDTRHFQLGAVTIAFNVVEDLCGRDWRPLEVTFACRPPADQRPLVDVEPALKQALDAETSALRAEMLKDFPTHVRRLMRKHLLVGRCTIEQVAATLSMHRRTLDRHLDRFGTSYGELLESVHYEFARQLLTDTRMSVQRIAEVMHFPTAADFATAFRRWSEITPSAYRARQH